MKKNCGKRYNRDIPASVAILPRGMLLAAVWLLAASCVTTADHSGIEGPVRSGSYSAALYALENEKDRLYGATDKVLYALDSGLLAHYAGDRSLSNSRLTDAERLIENYYTKSVTQSVSSFLTNDSVIDYAGEAYEDIYLNIFMALNYLREGNTESAFVEIRRFDNKQKLLATQYQEQIQQARAQSGGLSYAGGTVQFHNSALARYLSLIMYRAAGQPDSAGIDARKIRQAFEDQKQLYSFPVPSTLDGELEVEAGMARLNLLAFSGLAPVKEEQVFRQWSNDGSIVYKLALPVMKKRGSLVDSIEAVVTDATGAEVARVPLERLESMENIAVDTFQQRQSLLYLKSVARSFAKAAGTAVMKTAEDAAWEERPFEEALMYSLLRQVTQTVNEETERADLRTSRYFPAKASIAGISLLPGDYAVEVIYYNYSGRPAYSELFEHVAVTAKSVNIVESICLR